MKTVIIKHYTESFSSMTFTKRLPADYGDKRDYPAIDLYIDGNYYGTTTWARSLQVALDACLSKITASAGTKLTAERVKK